MPPIMANSKDGQGHKDKYLDISRKILSQDMILYFKQHFDTEEVILQQPREQVLYFYSTKTTK